MDVKEIDVLGDDIARHWYYRAKAAALSRLLLGVDFSRVLDVGAGSGFFSRHLLATSPAREALCVDPNYEADWDEDVNGKPLRFRREVGTFNADLALMMDVLEHVDDDVGLVAQYARTLRPGAHVALTVPAFAFLWSGHDVFLEHRRRYRLETLAPVVRQGGLEIQKLHYGFAPVFPIAATLRLGARLKGTTPEPRSQLKRHGTVTNALLGGLCALERPFMQANRLAGLSVFCLAVKPEAD